MVVASWITEDSAGVKPVATLFDVAAGWVILTTTRTITTIRTTPTTIQVTQEVGDRRAGRRAAGPLPWGRRAGGADPLLGFCPAGRLAVGLALCAGLELPDPLVLTDPPAAACPPLVAPAELLAVPGGVAGFPPLPVTGRLCCLDFSLSADERVGGWGVSSAMGFLGSVGWAGPVSPGTAPSGRLSVDQGVRAAAAAHLEKTDRGGECDTPPRAGKPRRLGPMAPAPPDGRPQVASTS